jgi:hypothetical protein
MRETRLDGFLAGPIRFDVKAEEPQKIAERFQHRFIVIDHGNKTTL